MKTSEELHKYRQRMKRSPTKSERIFRERLKEAGLLYKTQVIVGFYIVDFVLSERMLCIEIDGQTHDFQKEYDKNRDAFLSHCGFKVIRIKNEHVKKYDLNLLVEEPILEPIRFRSALATANSLRGRAMASRLPPIQKKKVKKKKIRTSLMRSVSDSRFKPVPQPVFKSDYIDPRMRKIYEKHRAEIEANRRRREIRQRLLAT